MIRLKSLLTEGSKLKDGWEARGVAVAKTLKSKLGLTSFQAAAIVGNFVEESGVRPDARQDMTGAGKYLPGPLKVDGKTGYSLAQWTEKGRQTALKNFADSMNLDITKKPLTTTVAVAFVVNEFNGTFANVLDKLKASKTLRDATNIILTRYEMPYNQGPDALKARTENAKTILGLMPKDTTTKKPAATVKKTTTTPPKTGLAAAFDYIHQEFDKANATAKAKPKSTTTTTYHTVQSGDTLSGLAVKYKTTVPNIKSLNNLKTDTIKAGQKLKVK
jgi:LysM repeat protein